MKWKENAVDLADSLPEKQFRLNYYLLKSEIGDNISNVIVRQTLG